MAKSKENRVRQNLLDRTDILQMRGAVGEVSLAACQQAKRAGRKVKLALTKNDVHVVCRECGKDAYVSEAWINRRMKGQQKNRPENYVHVCIDCWKKEQDEVRQALIAMAARKK